MCLSWDCHWKLVTSVILKRMSLFRTQSRLWASIVMQTMMRMMSHLHLTRMASEMRALICTICSSLYVFMALGSVCRFAKASSTSLE